MPRSQAPLFVMDGRGLVLRWSASAAGLFGYPAQDAVGRPAMEVLSGASSLGGWRVGPLSPGSDGPDWGVWATGPDEDSGGLDQAVLDAVFTQSSVGLHVLDPDLRVLRVNTVAVGMRGLPEDRILGRPVTEAYERYSPDITESVLREVLATGRPRRGVLVRGRPPTDPHREHVFSTSAYRIQDRSGRPLGVVATAVDVTEREGAQSRLRLLHAAHERIGRSLDVLRTARELVDVTVPAFAGSVLVALTDAVLRGEDPELLPKEGLPLLRCAASAGQYAGGTPKVGSVLLPGLFGDTLPERPALLPPEPDHPDHSTLVAPLTVRGQIFGVVAFQRPSATEPFDHDDLALADGIAAHTATCLENALRFTREHIVMTALQGWPLRPAKATRSALEVAQRHRPGGTGAGSWFDVIPLPGARVALVVGQVEQPGISAVATMSQLRTAVHSLTTLDLDPHELLARLHTTTLRLAQEQGKVPGIEEPTARCTFVVHDPVTGRIDVARAGSSLLGVVRPDGTIDPAPVTAGPLLGADGPPFACAELTLPPGSTLCLASDDAAPGTGRSTEVLAEALAHPERSPERMADDVERLLPPDAVLLVARTRRLPESELAQWDVPADASAVGRARHDVDRRLKEWRSPVDPFVVELVVSELLTNAVRYGSAPITLRLIRGEHTLTCEVTDSALTAPNLRHAKASDEGGRGLHICASLTESWGVRYSAGDKTVWAEIAERATL